MNKKNLQRITPPMRYDHFGYDWLDPVKSGTKKGLHPGIDFNWGPKTSSDFGLSVTAIMDGTVVYAGKNSDGWGNKIIIEHIDNMGHVIYSRYGHLSSIRRHNGDFVKGGEEIGKCGSTGASTGPHLHLDIWKTKQKTWGSYIYGWSKAKVLENYINPHEFLNIK